MLGVFWLVNFKACIKLETTTSDTRLNIFISLSLNGIVLLLSFSTKAFYATAT